VKSNEDTIALFGTSADPPTCGHQSLLEGLLTLFPKVITWASDNPMKQYGASLAKRQDLLKALVKAIENPNLELLQEISSPWTIKTLELANARWPSAELIFVIGSDLASQIPVWSNAKDVLKKARLGIAPRDGWPLQPTAIKKLESLGGRIELLPLKISASASSEVRTNPETKQIPAALLPMLLEHRLYGFTKDN